MRELDEVVEEPDRGARDGREEDGQARGRVAAQQRGRRRGRGDDDQHAAHRRRPLLDDVPLRPVLADELPELLAAQEGDEARAEQDREQHRHDRGDDHAAQTFAPASASATASSRTERDALTSTQSPGRTSSSSAATASAAVATARDDRDPALTLDVVRGERPDREQHVDADLRRVPAELAVVLRGVGPELGHVAEHRDAAARPARSARWSSAARIETGFAFQASLIRTPPPSSGSSSPRQRENAISAAPSCARSSGRPSAS